VDIRMGGMSGDDFIREANRKKPGMAFVICTGSPEYHIPDDLVDLPCVSETVFRKPVTDFLALEEALLRNITEIQNKARSAAMRRTPHQRLEVVFPETFGAYIDDG
jgi:FixJ family two-component response regulator